MYNSLKLHAEKENRMARRRAEAQAVLEGKRAAGEICGFMDAVGHIKNCLLILRVMRARVGKYVTLRDAAKLHSTVEAQYQQMLRETKFTNYAAAVRRVLRIKGMENRHEEIRPAPALAA